MAEQTRHVATYRLGDTIRINLDVSDDSGVAEVVALFRVQSSDTANYVYLYGTGGGKSRTTVAIEREVDTSLAPGEYTCDWVQLEDIYGNRTLVTGAKGLRFRIEGIPGDHEGPKLMGWQVVPPTQVVSPESIPSEESFGEAAVMQSSPQEGITLTSNSVQVTTGTILLVRHQGRYGAVQPVEQASYERGEFVRYAWWYQPDGSGVFINDNTQFGFGDSRAESAKTGIPRIKVGPIELEWSIASEGSGYVYFGPSSTPSPDYELFLTDLINISSVNAENYVGQFRAGRATI